MRASVGGTGGDFPILDENGYPARVYSIVDIGIHNTKHGDKHQVIISWELPLEIGDDGRPYALSKFETLSLHEKANLRKLIEAMKGKIPAEKLEDQDFIDNLFLKVLGTPAMLSVSQYKNKDGYLRNGIEGVGKLMKGVELPPAINEPVLFDMDHFDQSVYKKLPEWQQKLVDIGKEGYQNLYGNQEPPKDNIPDLDSDNDDDVDW